MRIQSLIIGSMVLLGTTLAMAETPATAETMPLTEEQMDSVTAGTHEHDITQEAITGSFDVNQDNGDIVAPIGNKDVETENMVNLIDSKPNSVTEDNSVNAHKVVLKDYAQQDAKAGVIINNINGQIANGFNGQINKDLGLSGSSPVKLNQSNIIIQK